MINQQTTQNGQPWPAGVDAEAAARFLGWPAYFMPFLARVGHLKPLGKPGQNARKWYAMVELERLSRDPAWLARLRGFDGVARRKCLKIRATTSCAASRLGSSTVGSAA